MTRIPFLKHLGFHSQTTLTMTKKEPIQTPQLDMQVFHENIYNGNLCMKIVGIRKTEVELEGDFSGGTHNVNQKDWFPIEGLFRLRKVCAQIAEHGSCQLHNLHCGYPKCEPYLTSDHYYDNDGVRHNQ